MTTRVAKCAASVLAAMLVVSASSVAFAQDDANAQAAALFRDARKAMDAQDYLLAKTKLEASRKLVSGAGTLINLAYCYEHLGLPAKAYRLYREAAALATQSNRPDRVQAANDRLREVRRKIGFATLVLSQPGITVTVDGAPVDVSDGAPLDEGRHVLRAAAPGRLPWSTVVSAKIGERFSVTVPELATDASAVPTPARPANEGADDRSPAHAPTSVSARSVVGLSLAGAGVVGIGIGVVVGLGAKSTYDQTNAYCNDQVCDATGLDLIERAKTAATISTVVVGAGAAAVAGGLVLYFTGPASASTAARIEAKPTQGGLQLAVGKTF